MSLLRTFNTIMICIWTFVKLWSLKLGWLLDFRYAFPLLHSWGNVIIYADYFLGRVHSSIKFLYFAGAGLDVSWLGFSGAHWWSLVPWECWADHYVGGAVAGRLGPDLLLGLGLHSAVVVIVFQWLKYGSRWHLNLILHDCGGCDNRLGDLIQKL